MTNGEKIKEVFPSIGLYEKSHDAIQINFDSVWWNAEYKEPTTKNDLGVEYISRSELMAILSDYYDTTVEYRSMLKEIAALPSVTPQEPKKGYWTYIRNSEVNGLKIVECSECGKRTYGSGNYCPNCGADMREVEE